MISKRQKEVLEFIKDYQAKHTYPPSLNEIRKKMKLASVSTAHFHVEKLQELGFISKKENHPRSIDVFGQESMVMVPLLGKIAAGQPIEVFQEQELIAVPKSKLPNSSKIYALRVIGNSMVDENINNGDIVLINHQEVAENGQKVVALINNNEATLKKYYKEKNHIRLQPANRAFDPIIIKNSQDIAIQGTVIDVMHEQLSFESVLEPKEVKQYEKLPINSIICGDAIEEMKKIPNDTIDMTFADPPFNLNKKYGSYKDKKIDIEYIKWTERWLDEMVRITKPSGSIFVHNIPKWLIYNASFLNKKAFFKHWIAWDSMSTPLGKTLLPAHYGILFYTKSPKGFKFHELRAPHKKCRKCGEMIKDYGGKKDQINPHGTLLSDVWADIHRIRHNTRRDNHPCQLPEPLLERLILMSTDEGDVVLDPFIGAGTTALAAKRLGRKYIGIDVDSKYKEIVNRKLAIVKYRDSNGYKYDGVKRKTSNYLKNLTISEMEGIHPLYS